MDLMQLNLSMVKNLRHCKIAETPSSTDGRKPKLVLMPWQHCSEPLKSTKVGIIPVQVTNNMLTSPKKNSLNVAKLAIPLLTGCTRQWINRDLSLPTRILLLRQKQSTDRPIRLPRLSVLSCTNPSLSP